jgi:dephospho-CoA kinase
MLTVALTGNIASGKSTVAQYFSELGAPIIDTDQLAREAVLPESHALEKIVARFGSDILLAEGTLNRKALREKIFSSREDRLWLEKLLHPIIREKAQQLLVSLNTPYAIYIVPLLAGREPNAFIQRVLLVDLPIELQHSRAFTRDKLTAEMFEKILQAQASRDELLRIADDIIVNDKNFDHLKSQVLALHEKYLALAGE